MGWVHIPLVHLSDGLRCWYLGFLRLLRYLGSLLRGGSLGVGLGGFLAADTSCGLVAVSGFASLAAWAGFASLAARGGFTSLATVCVERRKAISAFETKFECVVQRIW